MLLALPLPSFAGGCYLDGNGNPTLDPKTGAQDFAEVWAANWCQRQHDWNPGDFDKSWNDTDECRAEKSSDAEFASDFGDIFCGDYSVDAASECISAVNGSSCADFSDNEWRNECEPVFGC